MSEQQNTVVVDACLALKWITSETDTPSAQRLLDNWMQHNFIILTPDLIMYEITNVLLKRVRREELTLERIANTFHLLMQVGLNFEAITDENLSLEALDFAIRYKLPASYDAHYLALAAREQCEFWTADERLYNSVKGRLSWVRLMSDLASISASD